MSLLTRKILDAPISNGFLLDYLAQPGTAPVISNPVVTLGISDPAVNTIGIISVTAFGSPSIDAVVSATGIASITTVGQPSIGATVNPVGIASVTAFGTPTIGDAISLVGIATVTAFGSPTITLTAVSDNAKNRGGKEIDSWERKLERDRREYDERERMYLEQDESDIMAIIASFLETVE